MTPGLSLTAHRPPLTAHNPPILSRRVLSRIAIFGDIIVKLGKVGRQREDGRHGAAARRRGQEWFRPARSAARC